MKALLIYSGGLDSTSALYLYKEDIKLAISFNYGSKHNNREIDSAKLNCKKLNINHKIIDVKEVFKNMDSSLLDRDKDVPHGHYAEDNMASTVVPFRNGIMLSIAAGIAESNGMNTVMLASHRGDNAQYPDCTPGFNLALAQAITAGTSNKVQLFAPFEAMDKREIAKLGKQSGMEPELTYSCYEGDNIHCGKCGTCVERIWALSGSLDLTKYKDTEYAVNILKKTGEL